MSKHVAKAARRRIIQIDAIIKNLNKERKELEDFINSCPNDQKKEINPKGVMLDKPLNIIYSRVLESLDTSEDKAFSVGGILRLTNIYTEDKVAEILGRLCRLGLIYHNSFRKNVHYYKINRHCHNYIARKESLKISEKSS